MTETLFGCDVFCRTEKRARIKSIGFKDFENVSKITVEDFYYKNFIIQDGWFLLYDDEVEENASFPALSVFAEDVSMLPFIENDAVFETEDITETEEPKKYVSDNLFGIKQNLPEGAQTGLISGKYTAKGEMNVFPVIQYVSVNKIKDVFLVSLNAPDGEFIKKQLVKFFAVDESKIFVEAETAKQISSEYIVSVLRAAIIAVQASMKFGKNIIFQFNPFYNTGKMEVERETLFDIQTKTVIGEKINVGVQTGKATQFRKEILLNIMAGFLPVYSLKYIDFHITLSEEPGVYNTDIGCKYYDMAVELTMEHTEKIGSGMGFQFVFDSFCMEKTAMTPFLNLDRNDVFISEVIKMLEKSDYYEKKYLYSHTAGKTAGVSGARRLERKIIPVISYYKNCISSGTGIPDIEKIYRISTENHVFDISGCSFFIIEFNELFKEIIKVYAVVCIESDMDEDTEKQRIKSSILGFGCRKGFSVKKGFKDSDLVLKMLKSENGFSYTGIEKRILGFMDRMTERSRNEHQM